MFNKAPAMIAYEVSLVRVCDCVCVKKCTKWCDATQTDEDSLSLTWILPVI